MEVTGKLVKKLDLETGTSKAGKEWQKQTVVIDTGEDFNNLIAISSFGDKMQKMNMLEEGMTVSIMCNVYSREYNGKYYHNIEGYHFANQTDNPEVNADFTTSDDTPF
mgnify:FL=1|tara:strand:- start:4991 stop:5314 length:324 start_codon:yes stop_codon:yes gene_type:complete